MDSGAIMDNAHARSVARSIWGLDTINDQERIPIWLDCDTGLLLIMWSWKPSK